MENWHILLINTGSLTFIITVGGMIFKYMLNGTKKDIEYIKQSMDKLEAKIDNLPCAKNTERIAIMESKRN